MVLAVFRDCRGLGAGGGAGSQQGLTAYLRFPADHHNRVRHSNFIERTFGETRRGVKVIGRLPGETSPEWGFPHGGAVAGR